MKNIFSTTIKKQHVDALLFLARIAVGTFMLTHGRGKMENLFSGEEIKFADPFGVGQSLSLGLTVFAEVACSILIILGLATRLAVIPLAITMLTAIFIIHAKDGFGKKELASVYLLVYLILFVMGSGKYSLDNLISGKTNKNPAP